MTPAPFAIDQAPAPFAVDPATAWVPAVGSRPAAEPIEVTAGLAPLLADISQLVRPRIAVMVLATVVSAAWLTAGRPADPARLGWLLLGTALVAASSSIANQVLERRTDRLMRRTASRPLAAGRLAVPTATMVPLATATSGAR